MKSNAGLTCFLCYGVLADRRPLPARFLILGSASPSLLRQSSETLAGRVETVQLEGFRLADLGAANERRHWLRGGFPLSFTARTEANSLAWRRQFLQTFLERDLAQLGIQIPALALRRFWNMVAQNRLNHALTPLSFYYTNWALNTDQGERAYSP